MSKNPFQSFNERNIPYAGRRKLEKARLVPKTAQEKQKAEKDRLHELWLIEFDKRKQTLLKGEHAGPARALCSMLDTIGLDDGDLIIEVAQSWQAAPRSTRFLVLQLIDEALVALRERHLMPPFDDPLWGEEDNVFLRIRRLLT
jgi:hypothetical protein